IGTAMVPFTSGRLRVLAALRRQPEAFARESVGKPGLRASIQQIWRIFPFIATHLQLHLACCFDAFSSREPVPTPHRVRGRLSLENDLFEKLCCRETGGFGRHKGGKYRPSEV